MDEPGCRGDCGSRPRAGRGLALSAASRLGQEGGWSAERTAGGHRAGGRGCRPGLPRSPVSGRGGDAAAGPPTVPHQGLDLVGQGQGAQLCHGQDVAGGRRLVSVGSKGGRQGGRGGVSKRVPGPLLTSPPPGWAASASRGTHCGRGAGSVPQDSVPTPAARDPRLRPLEPQPPPSPAWPSLRPLPQATEGAAPRGGHASVRLAWSHLGDLTSSVFSMPLGPWHSRYWRSCSERLS